MLSPATAVTLGREADAITHTRPPGGWDGVHKSFNFWIAGSLHLARQAKDSRLTRGCALASSGRSAASVRRLRQSCCVCVTVRVLLLVEVVLLLTVRVGMGGDCP